MADSQLAFFGGAVEIADFCPFSQEFSWHLSGEFQRSSFCRLPENQPGEQQTGQSGGCVPGHSPTVHVCVRVHVCSDQWRNYGAEQYGPDSVCLYQRSAFVMEQCTRKMTYPDWGSGCYKVLLMLTVSTLAPPSSLTHAGPCPQVSCSGQGLVVFVQDRSFLCVHEGQQLSVSVRLNGWVYNGVLLCPACEDLCQGCPLPHLLPAPNVSRRNPIGQCRSSSESDPVVRRRTDGTVFWLQIRVLVLRQRC